VPPENPRREPSRVTAAAKHTEAQAADDHERRLRAAAKFMAQGLYVIDEPENLSNRRLIVDLAAKGRLPTIYVYHQFVEAGGLMAYGIDLSDLGHRIAGLVDKILKGAKPGEIPIFQLTKFDLTINLKAAKSLGLTVPPELLVTADEVIE
jgi:putative tryptophan/tyrosine transport system substrate-binding protein